MAKSKRVLFTFDARNYEDLRSVTNFGQFSNASDAVKDALQLSRALHSQAQKGFTDVIVRNPTTKEERVLVLPSLQAASAESQS